MTGEIFGAAMAYGGALGGDDYVDRKRRELTFVTTSDHPHTNGNVVISDGIDWRKYNANPLLLLGHEGGERDWRALPLGKWVARRSTRLPDGVPGVVCRARFASEEQVSKGSDAWHLADSVYRMSLPENGIVNQTSISWTAHQQSPPKPIRHASGLNGKYFQRSDMVEQSIVLIPANPNARRVDAGPDALLKRAASASVISSDEAQLIGRYVGAVRPYEVSGGVELAREGVHMQGQGGWVPFQAERLVGANDGTLRAVANVVPIETAESEEPAPQRAVASAAPSAAGADGGPILSPDQDAEANPGPRLRLGTQSIVFSAGNFDRGQALAWLHDNAYPEAGASDIQITHGALTFHPARHRGYLTGPVVEQSLDVGVTGYLRVRNETPLRQLASAERRPSMERYLATEGEPEERALIVRAGATVLALREALDRPVTSDLEIEQTLKSAQLLARALASDIDRMVAGSNGDNPDDEEAEKPKKKRAMRKSTHDALAPDDQQEEQTEPDDNPEEEDTENPKKKKASEGDAVSALERAAQRVGELLTVARRSRITESTPATPDATPAADSPTATYKAAHDRLSDLLASRRAQLAPDTPQGGEERAAVVEQAVK